jgi:periplasmic protein TonB
MFEQTFVEAAQSGERPNTLLLSLMLQAVAICILILIPLFYTDVLPSTVLRNLLVAPAVPPAVPAPPVPKTQTKFVARTFNPRQLAAPTVPDKVHSVVQAQPAPDIGIEGGSLAANGSGVPGVPDIGGSAPDAPIPPPAAPQLKEKPHNGPVRFGTGVAEANLIHKVMPVYPQIAKSTRVQGTVEFTALISKEGNIENIQLVRGHPLLVKPAREAVLQWKYRPTLLNGVPVEVITDIIVNFSLTQ